MKKVISIILILTFLLFCISCSEGNTDTDTKQTNIETDVIYQDGYHSPLLWSALFCAAEYETKAFSIDDVSLTFYYGVDLQSRFDDEEENKNLIIITARNHNQSEYITLIEHSVDEIFTEKYECECEIGTRKWTFNHSEKIQIPSELFLGESGKIIIEIDQEDDDNNETRVYGEEQIAVSYTIKNGLVYLS